MMDKKVELPHAINEELTIILNSLHNVERYVSVSGESELRVIRNATLRAADLCRTTK